MPEFETPALKDRALLVDACLIGGAWSKAGSGSIDVTNPATGAKIGTGAECGEAETAPRHRGGRRGLPAWRARTANERAEAAAQAAATR